LRGCIAVTRVEDDQLDRGAGSSESRRIPVKKSGIAVFVVIMTLFLGFGARPASALICCSVCAEDHHNPACRAGCSESCVVDDEPSAPETFDEDDVARVCYVVTTSDAVDDDVTVAST
jgi:hypothetical protein